MDDIVVKGRTPEEVLEKLMLVLMRLSKEGLFSVHPHVHHFHTICD